nr:retrovirus-related Pol polyprotein LINE-1 [Tanacetum cinerariifolium]
MKMEELIVYLAAAREAMGTILITEREAKQMPIYFVSRALQEGRYNGSGDGLILTSLEGTKFTYALRFEFDATNNESEYEALIAGIRIAEQMGIKNLQTHVDSCIVVNQVNGSYIAKEPGMIQYMRKVKTLANSFKKFSIKQVPRSESQKADALSKIASTSFAHLTKQVLVEVLKEKSINEKEVLTVVEEEGNTWMTPIYEYLTEETLPAKWKHVRAKLDSKKRANDIYKIAKAQERRRRDIGNVRYIKDEGGRSILREENIRKRWGEYFSSIFNESSSIESRPDRNGKVESSRPQMHYDCYFSRINQGEVRVALQKMGCNKAVGPDQFPIEAWRCLGNEGGDAQACSNYMGIKLLSHTMKLWERVIERRLRRETRVPENQFGFMPGSSMTEAIHLLRSLMEKCMERQRDLHMAFLDLEKAYDSISRELIWRTLIDKETPRRYSRIINDMYEVVHQEVDIRIRDRILHPNESFRYLGSVVHRSRRIYEDVAHRIRIGWMKWRAASGIRCDRRMPLKGGSGGIENDEVDLWRPQTAPVRRVKAMVVEGLRRRVSLMLCFRSLSLSISLMHTYTGRRSPESSLFTFEFILRVGVESVYILPPLYPASAGLGLRAASEPVKGQERRPRPTIGKLKPSLRKRRIEMRLRRMPMELDFFDSLIGIRMRSERPSLGQTMQGQQVTFSCQTFLARLRLLIGRIKGKDNKSNSRGSM